MGIYIKVHVYIKVHKGTPWVDGDFTEAVVRNELILEQYRNKHRLGCLNSAKSHKS